MRARQVISLQVDAGFGHRAGAGQPGPAVPDPHRDSGVRQVAMGARRANPGRKRLVRSKIALSGEMPEDIGDVFAGLGLSLFHGTAESYHWTRSRDYAVPCKHLAATFYLLAESFDEDPFAILACGTDPGICWPTGAARVDGGDTGRRPRRTSGPVAAAFT